MNYIDDIEFKSIKNSFLHGKHPDTCPVCKEEPAVYDIPMPFTSEELWVVRCKCTKPITRAVTGDSASEAVSNWDNMIKRLKENTK